MRSGNLVWVDLEMTGLNPFEDRIIEIAVVITNKDLEELAVGRALQFIRRILSSMRWIAGIRSSTQNQD